MARTTVPPHRHQTSVYRRYSVRHPRSALARLGEGRGGAPSNHLPTVRSDSPNDDSSDGKTVNNDIFDNKPSIPVPSSHETSPSHTSSCQSCRRGAYTSPKSPVLDHDDFSSLSVFIHLSCPRAASSSSLRHARRTRAPCRPNAPRTALRRHAQVAPEGRSTTAQLQSGRARFALSTGGSPA